VTALSIAGQNLKRTRSIAVAMLRRVLEICFGQHLFGVDRYRRSLGVAILLQKSIRRCGHTERGLTPPALKSIALQEVAEQLSKVVGRTVRYVSITPEKLAASARRYGVDEWMAVSFRDYNQA